MKITMFLGMLAMAAPGIVSAAGRESPLPAGIIVPPTSIYD